jgi:hypothetical protein
VERRPQVDLEARAAQRGKLHRSYHSLPSGGALPAFRSMPTGSPLRRCLQSRRNFRDMPERSSAVLVCVLCAR